MKWAKNNSTHTQAHTRTEKHKEGEQKKDMKSMKLGRNDCL